MNLRDTFKNWGDAAAEAAKTAGGKAQDLAKAAQEKAAYLKEVNELKGLIREQKSKIAEVRSQIADKVLAQVADGKNELPTGVIELAADIKAAEERIAELNNRIEDLKAAASVKNPEIEREINRVIAEIDKVGAIDIEPADDDTPAEDTAKPVEPADTTAEKTE